MRRRRDWVFRLVVPALVVSGGCGQDAVLRGKIVGTWEGGSDDPYGGVITYHSDGTWVLIGEKKKEDKDDAGSEVAVDILLFLLKGDVMPKRFICSGTWKVVDGRLVHTLTAADNKLFPIGLTFSEEVVSADRDTLKTRSPQGEVTAYHRKTYPAHSNSE